MTTSLNPVAISPVEDIVADMRAGRMVILVDEEDRENEGDLILASDHVTPEAINFMARHARGLICLTLSREMCERLKLPPMVARNNAQHATAFTVSIEAAEGVTTGISAADRSRTVQAAVAPNAQAQDLVQPGHIFPLQAVDGGVLMRAGHTEAGCDLATMAGCSPSSVICEVMNEDGTMARLPQLLMFAKEWGLKVISIKDMIEYRLKKESLIEIGEEVDLPTEYGHFHLIPFRQASNGLEHMALIKGEWKEDEPILVRVHSSCATGDILGSKRCDCGQQLHKAMEMIEKEGKGVLIYMQQEGRGIGLMNKIAAYKLQEEGYDTVDANTHLGFKPDERDYGCGAQMLRHLGVHKMRLMTNNPVKRVGLEAYGLEIVENIAIETTPNKYNERYLKTKRDRMGHMLHLG